eukprot:395204-Prorocentrum_minimum.AAC.1
MPLVFLTFSRVLRRAWHRRLSVTSPLHPPPLAEKIQTDDLQRIEATSADNVLMHTDATVVWRVSDVLAAARMSAETMRRVRGRQYKPV